MRLAPLCRAVIAILAFSLLTPGWASSNDDFHPLYGLEEPEVEDRRSILTPGGLDPGGLDPGGLAPAGQAFSDLPARSRHKPGTVLRYEAPFQVGDKPVVLRFRARLKKKSIVKLELLF